MLSLCSRNAVRREVRNPPPRTDRPSGSVYGGPAGRRRKTHPSADGAAKTEPHFPKLNDATKKEKNAQNISEAHLSMSLAYIRVMI